MISKILVLLLAIHLVEIYGQPPPYLDPYLVNPYLRLLLQGGHLGHYGGYPHHYGGNLGHYGGYPHHYGGNLGHLGGHHYGGHLGHLGGHHYGGGLSHHYGGHLGHYGGYPHHFGGHLGHHFGGGLYKKGRQQYLEGDDFAGFPDDIFTDPNMPPINIPPIPDFTFPTIKETTPPRAIKVCTGVAAEEDCESACVRFRIMLKSNIFASSCIKNTDNLGRVVNECTCKVY